MASQSLEVSSNSLKTLEDLAELVDYSLLNHLNSDPDARPAGHDHAPRQVFSGHYVPVRPTPIAEPEYIAHSSRFFQELGFEDSLASTEDFRRVFSGDLSQVPEPMRQTGWATGYALSIYGTEYTQQCPFRTGNGYGDGRAISVVELVSKGQRWEMQLKGGGQTPYCRGADGRAVLRSSVREFLAQEHMHALGVPTSRSLCLFVSKNETVDRPWYSEGSNSMDPDVMVSNPVAITTRVAPSFLRVGQLELFGRRARKNEYPEAFAELEMIVTHLIEREYQEEIGEGLAIAEKVLLLARKFLGRLTSMVADWIRVGYCQGNFNSDNCAAGGYTLDYGPFGFCEQFEPFYQPWTGGGRHFSFLNQPAAAKTNYEMFCTALRPLLISNADALAELDAIRSDFAPIMQDKLEAMWAAKLGIAEYDSDLFSQLLELMMQTSVDYTLFFRELSGIPEDVSALKRSFYQEPSDALEAQWLQWLKRWRSCLDDNMDTSALSEQMKRINPKYTWREWLVVPAYEQAKQGDYSLIKELQEILNSPFDEQTPEVENKYYRLRPAAFVGAGGVSHYSCSS